MQRILGILIALVLLGYGLVRIGAGGALLAQVLGLVDIIDLKEAVTEVQVFIAARKGQQLVPISVPGYFAYIFAMGVVLTAGAIAAFSRIRIGYVLLTIYLFMHAALFVNFQEINPKLIGLVLQCVLVWGLFKLRSPSDFVRRR